jgi:CheY-like chemotaxis protein
LARVLLVHSDLAPRLALQTILQAGGYSVDVAATPSEGLAKLDEAQYDLVLTDGESHAARNVLRYARVKDYKPATAVIKPHERIPATQTTKPCFSIYTENVPSLLERVAELIGLRAIRRYRPVRQGV